MKNSIKLFTFLIAVAFASTTFASDLGINMADLRLAPTTSDKSSSSGNGIEKGTLQIDANFNLGSHAPIVGRHGSFYSTVGFRPGFTLNIDYAVHPYASVGGYFGFDGRYGVYGLGFGARGVFHIYQLMSDKANTKVDPDKLDFYFPLHIGGAVYAASGGGSTGGFQMGAGLGVRYYFTHKFGMNFEVGWLEMSVAKVGFAFKL